MLSEFRSEGSVFVRPSCPAISLDKMLSLDQEEGCQISPDSLADDFMHNQGGQRNTLYSMDFTHPLLQRGSVLSKSNRSSHGSDTSSAYSGSDTMQSVQSVSLDDQDVDLSGLVESIVDSDEEEELTESMESLTVRDTVRECLEKDPALRTEEDVGVILEYMQHLPAFANMTLTVRKALCAVMVFAVVDKPGVVVMNDGEELDSWSVIVNGAVEIELPDGKIKELQIGDSFGITPTMAKMYQVGVMRTKVEDCQFVCVAQSDYYRILHQGEENIKKHEENGKLVYVTELRTVDAAGNKSHIIIRGTPERLLEQLVEDNSTDVTYVEDFLLAYRTFISDCKIIADKLLVWFDDPRYRDRVTRVVLLWVHNHFTDFETDVRMMEFLEQFELKLEKEKMLGQQRLLNIACAAKARSRVITLARSTREEVLHFSILGGYETGFATFVSKVDKGSKAEEVGLKRGDQILEVNGQSFEVMSHVRALELLRGTTHLCITVKSNLLAFKEMLSAPENSTRRCRKASEISLLQHDPRARLSSQVEWHETMGSSCGTMPGSPTSKVNGLAFRSSDGKKDGEKKGYSTLGHRAKLRRVLAKINIIPRTLNSESHLNSSDDSLCSGNSSSSGGSGNYSGRGSSPQPCTGGGLYHSHSNPDLTSLLPSDDLRLEFPEHVLKVYRSDQTCKYLLVHKETTAREVVMLSLREFGITESSSKYCLCEVSVGEGGVVKQRRLPDPQQNLAERISLSSRYYLKNNMCSDSLVPDELAVELLRDSQVHLLQLNSVELATQLTIEDFSIFRQIEPTEYIDELFEVKSKYGTPMLSKFVELVNREMFWVVTEVCFEHNLLRRMRIIKQFIKVARQCKECKNFNSMFAIISGLGHGAVSRLRTTWEKLPTKYMKLFEDLQDFMDPSRNMYKYRNLISSEHIQPPMIPFYPVLKKDLTFIHLGNDSYIDGLVNFEKLRMVAKEIRTVLSMCSAPYDLFNMLESGGAHPTAAMASLNSFATTTNAATVKRRKKSSAQPNPKKMFEEAQMVRRVKAYLSNLKVVTDEDQLHAMSVECEPLITSGVSTLQVRKRQPSPTLSAASSNSSSSDFKKCNSSKFDSPQAVRKLLALSDPNKVRPHQPLRPPVSGSPSLSPVSVRRCHDPRPSFSAEMGNATIPVDLYPESSSVTSFGMASIKKSQTSGSVTSSESLHLQHCETDSGHGSASFDSHSNSSGGSTNSPPHLKRNASGPSASHTIKKFSE
ncbi:rap guanine nucleotide exchange factor 2-like isoform X2 [Stegodyphus dumicola]|uniref:rap guanine nucleotide exchange factor 2-like isoform X2 n=1 Tax=Stegodyphus dumicola TaxID=202533 RepID=UPI0015A84B61|nr:rap guanine nucleotide exchange factor 2-like isoform X2 [Stegodyphus dumicola]